MLHCDKPVLCLCITGDKGAQTEHTRCFNTITKPKRYKAEV
jgi:hypothetical protein